MRKKNKNKEILDYDQTDVTAFIDRSKNMQLEDIGFELPTEKISKIVSIRLPTKLVHALQSLGTQKDVPYQSLIKMYLWEKVERELKRSV